MGSMQSSMARRSQNLPMSTPTGRHNPLCSQYTSSTISKTRETNFRLPEGWESQEILDEEVVGEKTYYLISWKPTLVPETEWLGTIIGEEVLDGATHYRFQWEPTFEPDSNLVDMAELLKEWKLKLRTRSGRLYTERRRVGIRRKSGRGRSPKRRDSIVE
ncbi:hypothetical protein PG985_005548 [Apiospora marii]|uniref:uncharacterized protein n=1 Tax=Apiospora marii TaxID=335849 RepID=UPI00312E6F0C